MKRESIAARHTLCGVLVLLCAWTTQARALPACSTRATASQAAHQTWAAPLDRLVTIAEPDLPLRAALDRVAAASRLRLTYSADLLPSDRRVCVKFERTAVGAVLNELLRTTTLHALVLDTDNVVLAPSRGPTATERGPEMLSGIGQLDRVVVTGTADGARQRSSPYALDVLDGRTLAGNDASTLSSAFDGAVPGVWMWTQSPSSVISRFGSVRGASSFGVTSPKIYIDGVEVSNPLVMTQFDPERIDRVEVIRGPQGAALYGADAISGVVNIITRHDGATAGEPLTVLHTRAGVSASAYSPRGAFVQDHSFSVRAGNGRRSFGLGASVGSVGDYIPGGAARSLMADGDFRVVGGRTVVTGIARFAAKDAGASASPLLAGLGSAPMSGPAGSRFGKDQNDMAHAYATGTTSPPDTMRGQREREWYDSTGSDSGNKQSVRQYTVGTTAAWMPSARWAHTLVMGIDGYRLNGVSTEGMPLPERVDSLQRAAHGEADHTTLTVRSVAHLGLDDDMAATLTFGAEHAATRQQIEIHQQLVGGDLSLNANSPTQVASVWSSTAGVLAQANAAWRNTLYMSAGGRVERSTGLVTGARVNVLPMLGVALVRELDGLTYKLRASYGKGIRPSNSIVRAATWMSGQASTDPAGPGARLSLASLRNLDPETQAGVEAGADVLLGTRLGLHITRFDQRATGLIQAVALPAAAKIVHQQPENGVTYELQNVGAIRNKGWELQATSAVGHVSLQASASFVDSRVERVAMRYGGDLRAGDRMLEVPASTFSLMASYSSRRWATAWTVARATDWINYDQLRIAQARTADYFDAKPLTGPYLREFWRQYSGATRLRGNATYALTRGLSLVVTGDNLFNLQRGEPDNVTVVPGRTLTAGLRTRF